MIGKLPLTRPDFDARDVAAVERCLASGWVTEGPQARELERLFAARHQARFARVTSSCTAALHVSALAVGWSPGDEVIVPAFTWITSANAAEYAGARAVFADVDPVTFNLDPAAAAAAVTPRTRGIVVVHLFGLAAELDPILTLARRHQLTVVEDAACAVGTTYRDRPVGTFGALGCFSFHPRKVISTGEGGMVITDDPALDERVQSLRNHGSTGMPSCAAAGPPPPWQMSTFERLGYNLRLSDIQASIGVVQMGKLDGLLAERRALARGYHERLGELADLALPVAPAGCGHTYQSYVVRLREGGVERRNRIMQTLAEEGVETRPGTHAVHRLGFYAQKYRLRSDDFPIAAACEDTSITLPLFPRMNDGDQDRVASAVGRALAATVRE